MIKNLGTKSLFKSITFKSLSGSDLEFKNSYLNINRDLLDMWTPFLFNSVGSFKKVLINIKDRREMKTVYFILSNVNLESDGNNLSIKLLGEPIKYISVKHFKDTNIEEKKKLKSKINYLKSYNQVSGETKEFIKLKLLEERLYELEAIRSFSLQEEE